jgi:hypothetical protein
MKIWPLFTTVLLLIAIAVGASFITTSIVGVRYNSFSGSIYNGRNVGGLDMVYVYVKMLAACNRVRRTFE